MDSNSPRRNRLRPDGHIDPKQWLNISFVTQVRGWAPAPTGILLGPQSDSRCPGQCVRPGRLLPGPPAEYRRPLMTVEAALSGVAYVHPIHNHYRIPLDPPIHTP